MAMSKQARKHTIGLAGEFLVAGELLRRGVMAAVTYGNAKKADVIAFHQGRSLQLEVKSTSERKWVLGGDLPAVDPSVWVLVFLPPATSTPPEYFVLSSAELRALLLPVYESWMAGYVKRRGKEFTGKGVISVERSMLGAQHAGAWHKITLSGNRRRWRPESRRAR